MTPKVVLLPLFVLLVCTSHAQTASIGSVNFSRNYLEVGRGEPSFAVADLNSDDRQDVVVCNGDLTIFLGDGSGLLNSVGRFPAGQNPNSVDVADINADGVLDLVVSNHETLNVTLLIGKGDGTFRAAPNSPLTVNVQPHPHVAQAKDIDADGRLDLLVDHRVGRGLLFLRGLGEGRFESQGRIIDVGGDPYLGFAVSDVNGDGRLDFITPNDNDVGITLNLGNLQFERIDPVKTSTPMVVLVADINGDGTADLISASEGNAGVQINLGVGAGKFQSNPIIQFDFDSGGKQIATGDFNGDAIADVLVSNWNSSEVMIIFGDKQRFQVQLVKVEQINNPWSVVAADLNEDGVDDFLVGDGNGTKVEVFLSQQ